MSDILQVGDEVEWIHRDTEDHYPYQRRGVYVHLLEQLGAGVVKSISVRSETSMEVDTFVTVLWQIGDGSRSTNLEFEVPITVLRRIEPEAHFLPR